MSNFINYGIELLKEEENSDIYKDHAYKHEEVDFLIENSHLFHQKIEEIISKGDQIAMYMEDGRFLFLHHGILRQRRYLMAYHYSRLSYILNRSKGSFQDILWNDKGLPSFDKKIYERYIKAIQIIRKENEILNIYGEDNRHPNIIYITIRVKEDLGEVLTENGSVILKKNSFHYIRKSDIQHLLNLNYVEEL